MNYYNENDKHAAQWLRNLIAAGKLPDGWVDDRSIEDVKPSDLEGFTQHHFFAGVGGWSLALRLARWPSDVAVWTGSCPCQPFSTAGRRKGVDDPRHLWPVLRWLIQQCNPPVVFGEQVASPAGRAWLSGVQTDLEILGYGSGAADLCAAGIGAPHIRQRLFWVADSSSERRDREHICLRGRRSQQDLPETSGSSKDSRAGHTNIKGLEGRSVPECEREGERLAWETGSNAHWIPCADGKQRRIKPGIKPVVDGFSERMEQLRGYGNAIVPQVAAIFIQAYMETQNES